MLKNKLTIAFAWSIVIFILSVIPGKDLPEISINYFDKLAHAGVYAILSWLVLRSTIKWSNKNLIVWVFVIPMIYGILIEFFQGTFLNDRIADVYDMIANGIGSLTVTIMAFIFRR